MIVVLVGFMGAGKTTVGHILAGTPRLTLRRFRRPDRATPRTIHQDIFETEGEGFFRELEHQTVSGLASGEDAVLALGGGALGDARTRAALRNARVVHLRVG